MGARLEARFRPALYWGAEFLADKVRLCAFPAGGGAGKPLHTFEGSYAQAAAFADSHGLAYEGLRGAVSHLPFKIEPMDPSADNAEDDILPRLETVRPPGLPADALDAHAFHLGEERYLILAREDSLRAFTEKLHSSLGALWSLDVSPLALAPFLDAKLATGHWAAVICESDYSHLLFFRDASLMAYAKVFTGWELAQRDAAAFATEMKKALVYHFGSRFPGASLDGIQIWREGTPGEAATALKSLGIPQFTPDWGPLASVTEPFRVAAALAYRGLRNEEPIASFAVPAPTMAVSRRLWRKRTGALARGGYLALSGVAIGVALLAISAVGLRWTVESKAKTWSGELQRWNGFRAQKAAVETELGSMKGLLGRRTEGYAGMQRIAGLLPPELWLETWELESGSGRRFTHRLEGYSLVEARVPEFLGNLEKTGRFASVKLKSTERIKGETIEEKTRIAANRKDLVRFQIGTAE